jgi:hypothetical protein
MPHFIVSNRDPILTNNFRQELYKIQGTQLYLSTSYQSQNDGQTEVINNCLETCLQFFSSNKQN